MTPIVIPAYEPDERLLLLLETLKEGSQGPVVIVDDGSGHAYKEIFEQAGAYVEALGGVVLTHEVNRGKGRALKTAFACILKKYPEAVGCVTADSDGQHTVECIEKVRKTLEEHPDSLVLGVRRFDGKDVPWRSRMGNGITERVFAYVSGVHVTDTQTGLRGIPRAFMEELLDVQGERFEFETQMLLESAGSYPIIEVPIRTIYDSKENHQTEEVYEVCFFLFFFLRAGSGAVHNILQHVQGQDRKLHSGLYGAGACDLRDLQLCSELQSSV